MNAIITTNAKKITQQESIPHEIFLSKPTTKTVSKKEDKPIKPLPKQNLQIDMQLKPIVQKINVEAPKLTQIKSSISIKPMNVEKISMAKVQNVAPSTTQNTKSSLPNLSKEEPSASMPEYETIDSFLVLKRVEPRYPRRAKRRGLSGFVDCKFKINPKGEVFDIEIIKSNPKGVFEKAAIKALEKWKFNKFEASKKYKLSTVKFNFKVE